MPSLCSSLGADVLGIDSSESDDTSRIKDTDVDIVKFIDEEFDVSQSLPTPPVCFTSTYVYLHAHFTYIGADINGLMGLVT